MPSFEILGTDPSSVAILVNDVSPGDSVRFFIRLYNDTSDVTVDDTVTADSTVCIGVYNELIADTKYSVNVRVNSDWLGSQTFTTPEESSESERPENWEWYSTISAGKKIRLSAEEWNDFCDRINDFRVYAGLSEYSFTTVYSRRTKISATIVNQARTAISAIDGHGTLPSRAYADDPITASFFIKLANALNDIP